MRAQTELLTHTSEEIAFILNKVINCLEDKNQASNCNENNSKQENIFSEITTKKVLFCGQWEELEPCLVALARAASDRTELLERVIVATKNMSELCNENVMSLKPQIVEWDESVYEEYLIKRVKAPNDQFSISLAIDFSPTLRRIERIRQLLEKDGTLIITDENLGWRQAKPSLLQSFSENGGCLIKMTECLSVAAQNNRRVNLLRSKIRRSYMEDSSYAGRKGR